MPRLLAWAQRLLHLWVAPSGHLKGLVDPPHLGDDVDIYGDHCVERIQRGYRVSDRMPLDGRDHIRGEDVEMEGGQ